MNIIFLGQFPTKRAIMESNGAIDSLYRDSAAVIDGLRTLDYVDLSVVSSPDVISYPKGRLYFQSFYDEYDNAYSVSNLNLPVLKQLWTILAMTKKVLQIAPKNMDFCVIIPYMVFRHVLTTRLLKLIYGKRLIVCTIVPDIFFPKKYLVKYINKLTEKMARKSDSFVLYTDKMSEYLSLDTQKCITIEGFKNIEDRPVNLNKSLFNVVYTGSLERKYGLLRLIDSIPLLEDYPIEIHLYGDGDAVEDIKEAAKKYPNLRFYGKVPKKVATDVIYNASCLINPRNQEDGEFVEYSFPSKDIEYLGTGIPVILCKLPGMPREYWNHFIDAGNGTPIELAAAILKVFNMDIKEKAKLGYQAKQFVLDRMDVTKQSEKIVGLINKVSTIRKDN